MPNNPLFEWGESIPTTVGKVHTGYSVGQTELRPLPLFPKEA